MSFTRNHFLNRSIQIV